MKEIACPYCGAKKALGYLCPECGRTGQRVFVIAYRSSYGFQEREVEGFDNASTMLRIRWRLSSMLGASWWGSQRRRSGSERAAKG